jgi:capsular exopolysaccharide synthesis family protein
MRLLKRSHKDEYNEFKEESLQRLLSSETPFAVKEAYNSIRTKLVFMTHEEICPVFAMTSALPGDGKSINVINLAITFSQLNKRVLVIDADMRKPTMHKYFGCGHSNGLSEVLAGISRTVDVRPTNFENLSFLPAGDIPPNPAELLSNKVKVEELMSFIKSNFDYIFIDCPPVEVVTDATLLSSHISGYIFVVRSGKLRAADLKHAISGIQEVNGKILGFILNDTSGIAQNYYRKGYYGNRYNYKYYRYKYDYNYKYTDGEKNDKKKKS